MRETMPAFTTEFLDDYQKESAKTREALQKAMEKSGQGDFAEKLLSTLLNSGALQPPDPVKTLGMKMAKLIIDEGIVPPGMPTKTDNSDK